MGGEGDGGDALGEAMMHADYVNSLNVFNQLPVRLAGVRGWGGGGGLEGWVGGGGGWRGARGSIGLVIFFDRGTLTARQC